MTQVSAHVVAAELRERLPAVGTKKLHKLLYYCQGHHLATFGTPLFADTISAWDMGPVVGTLWYQEKEAGVSADASGADESVLNTVGYVISRYGALTGNDLERLTHSEDPWRDANARRTPGTSAKMSVDSIASYFRHAELDDEGSDTLLPEADEVMDLLQGASERLAEPGTRDSMEDLRARLRVSA